MQTAPGSCRGMVSRRAAALTMRSATSSLCRRQLSIALSGVMEASRFLFSFQHSLIWHSIRMHDACFEELGFGVPLYSMASCSLCFCFHLALKHSCQSKEHLVPTRLEDHPVATARLSFFAPASSNVCSGKAILHDHAPTYS